MTTKRQNSQLVCLQAALIDALYINLFCVFIMCATKFPAIRNSTRLTYIYIYIIRLIIVCAGAMTLDSMLHVISNDRTTGSDFSCPTDRKSTENYNTSLYFVNI